MSKSLMTRADFFTSIFFFVLGLYMTIEGIGMPGSGPIIEPGGEPGRVPIMLGVIMSFCAAFLLIRSVSRGGHKGLVASADTDEGIHWIGIIRCALTAIGCAFYAVGLVGSSLLGWKVPYHFATGVFMFLFIVGFEWEFAPELGPKRWEWVTKKFPGVAGLLTSIFRFFPASKAPYLWLLIAAFLQAVVVTWVVTYLFEQELYVRLP